MAAVPPPLQTCLLQSSSLLPHVYRRGIALLRHDAVFVLRVLVTTCSYTRKQYGGEPAVGARASVRRGCSRQAFDTAGVLQHLLGEAPGRLASS